MTAVMTRHAPRPDESTGKPLCVDLDGTLIHSDLLYESLLELLRRQPWQILSLPFWLLRGKAWLKRQIALRVELDPALLPYNEPLLAELRQLRGQRPLLLCSGSDSRLVHPVAEHLGLFGETLASDGATNLTGPRKARLLVERFGPGGYDYAGNQRDDLAVWRHASQAWVVNAGPDLLDAARKLCPRARHLPARPAARRQWLKALRPHQWLKNLLVFAPLVAAQLFRDEAAWLSSLLAFAAFSLCASALYLLNDLLDLRADRLHPRKRQRPFAAGLLALPAGLLAVPLLLATGLVTGSQLPTEFTAVLLLYVLCTLLYSLALKRRALVDVLTLAGLYTLRIVAGAAAIAVPLSFWFLAFSMFLFLSLAMIKRCTELQMLRDNGTQETPGRGYAVSDLPLLQMLGCSAGYTAVLVLALYIHSEAGPALYRHPEALWLLCPLLLLWISRIWLKAHRGLVDDDPLVFAARDPGSRWILLASITTLLWAL